MLFRRSKNQKEVSKMRKFAVVLVFFAAMLDCHAILPIIYPGDSIQGRCQTRSGVSKTSFSLEKIQREWCPNGAILFNIKDDIAGSYVTVLFEEDRVHFTDALRRCLSICRQNSITKIPIESKAGSYLRQGTYFQYGVELWVYGKNGDMNVIIHFKDVFGKQESIVWLAPDDVAKFLRVLAYPYEKLSQEQYGRTPSYF
jgi:hypothetical protein